MPSFGLGMTPNKPLETIVDYAKLAEDAIFDYVWLWELPPFNLDINTVLRTLASQTEVVKFGVLASDSQQALFTPDGARKVRELVGDRVVLGVGPREPKTTKPLDAELRKVIRALRSSWKDIPIYVGTMNRPELLRMAGEVADGALIMSPLGYFGYAIEQIEMAAEKAKRSLDEFVFAEWLPWSVGEVGEVSYWRKWSLEDVKDLVKPEVALIVATSPPVVFEKAGIEVEEADTVRKAFLEKGRKAAELVTDEMVDAFSFTGNIWDCNKKIIEFYKTLGFPKVRRKLQIVIGEPYGPDKREAIKTIGEETIFAIRMPYG